MQNLPPFHLAFPVHSLASAREFYVELLGCSEGRSSDEWIDFNFYGHQIVAHLDKNFGPVKTHNPVDGHDVPVPHFGLVLEWHVWEQLRDRLVAAHTQFVIEPTTRFRGKPGEQATLFLLDPSGNALEFKAFKDLNNLFAS